MTRGWLIACVIAGVVGLVLLVVCMGGVFFIRGIVTITQPVVDASDEFLTLLGQGKVAEAYAATADGFRYQQDEASFTAAVKQLGLTGYSSSFWNSREVKNWEGSVEGVITTRTGDTKPTSIRLIQERGKWKVVGVRYGGVELVTIKAPPPVPAEAELERMALEALLDFNQALTHFPAPIAWRSGPVPSHG